MMFAILPGIVGLFMALPAIAPVAAAAAAAAMILL